MGLAASQARLLFITSRQNDVSAKMQNISNQTMILARDSEEVSDKYNRMLNEKTYKLRDDVSLSYDSLMGSTAIDSLGQVNIVTNQDGKVVLSAADKNRYGITADTGVKGDFAKLYPSVDDFIKQADATNADAIIAAKPVTSTPENNGTDLTDSQKTVLNAFKTKYGEYPQTVIMTTINDKLAGSNFALGSAIQGSCDGYIKNTFNGATIADIINGKFNNVQITNQGDTSGQPRAQAKQNITAIANALKQALAQAFGIEKGSSADKKLDEFIKSLGTACDNWSNDTKIANTGDRKFSDTVGWTWRSSTRGSDTNDGMNVNVQGMLNWMTHIALNSGISDTAINDPIGTNKAQNFQMTVSSKGYALTEWEQALRNITTSGGIDFEKAKEYLTDKKTSTSTSNDGVVSNRQKYNCYKAIYDNLNNYGWSVEDTTSIQEKLKNGTYQLNGTVLSNNSDLYEEDTSADSTAKAEAYWKTEMGKINRKEKKLDQELTKLQTEYSSLTSDYESVKSIITQNIGKSFTYCQNG